MQYSSCSDFAEVIERLKRIVSTDDEEIVVRRDTQFLQDALRRAGRKSFNPTKTIRVCRMVSLEVLICIFKCSVTHHI